MVAALSSGESFCDQEEEFLVRTAAGEQEAYPAGVFQDHRTDLEELQTDGEYRMKAVG